MSPLQCLLCNQYLEISRRNGRTNHAYLNTLLLTTAIITLLITECLCVYDMIHHNFFKDHLDIAVSSGKDIGKLMGLVIGGIVYTVLRFVFLTQNWHERTIHHFNSFDPEEQDDISRKGIRYFMIVFVPVLAFMICFVFFIS